MGKAITFRKRIALELFRRWRKKKVLKHEMRLLFWECTLRCNLSCRHCGSDCRVDAKQTDMPAADFLKVIDSLSPHVNPNKLLVIFTGGEALVRTDLEACGLELYRRGYPWGIVSNGMLLSRRRLDALLAAGMHSITISLDGFEEAHNRLRCNPQSYARALAAVDMLVGEKDIVWDIVTCVNGMNIAELPAFRDFLIARGVARWRLFTIFPVGRAAGFPELQLTDDEFTGLLNFIRQTRLEGRIRLNYGCEGFLGGYEGEVRDSFYQCNAGVSVASILADGSISACPSIRANYRQGNIYADSLTDVWENRFRLYRDRSWARRGQCADCKQFRYCEGNGMHLRDDDGNLLLCHYKRITG
jgi:radical SAM enzyme (rSAM/lipoprotein system)